MEHRWGRRVPVQLPVRIRSLDGGTPAAGHMVNLSVSGALIATEHDAGAFSGVEIAVNNDWVLSWVTRRDPGKLAVEWMVMAPQSVIRQLEVAELTRTAAREPALA
jgi:hypothetical protein